MMYGMGALAGFIRLTGSFIAAAKEAAAEAEYQGCANKRSAIRWCT
jgi:hypothetical protein